MRSTAEWIGKTDDTAIPPRVKLRVYAKAEGLCARCGVEAWAGEYDHAISLVLGGQNRESNIQLLCVPCHRAKTKLDVKQKAKNDRVRKRHLGIRKQSKFACSRDSRWKKKINGEVVPRC